MTSFGVGAPAVRSAALAISLLGLSAAFPTLAAAFVAGALADRVDRRRLMRWVNAISVLSVLGLVGLLAAEPTTTVVFPPYLGGLGLPLWVLLLYPVWAVFYVASTLFRPTFNASIPRVLAPRELGAGNGLILTVSVGVSVAGSLAAGLLLDVAPSWAVMVIPLGLYLVAQFFLVALTGDFAMRRTGRPKPFLTDVYAGFHYLAKRPELATITLAALAINFLTSLAFIMFSLYVYDYLRLGAGFYGALLAFSTGGVAIGSVVAGRIRFERRAGRVLASLVFCLAATVLVLGFSRSPWIALPAVIAYGTAVGMFTTVFLAAIQGTVPDEILGRVLAADEVGSLALVPAGQYAGGLTTFVFGVANTFRLSGGLIAVVGAVVGVLPSLRRFGFEPKELAPRPAAPRSSAVGGDPPPGDPDAEAAPSEP